MASTKDNDRNVGPVVRYRQLGAEALGTLALTLTVCAVNLVAAGDPDISRAARAAAGGLVVMVVVYTLSDISGAHINASITFAFALRGVFAWKRVPAYWTAQLGGATVGAALACRLVGHRPDCGGPVATVGALRALFIETVLTMFLASTIINTSKRKATVGPQAAIAVGATLTVCGLWGGPLTGAAMNPAVFFGPALWSHRLAFWWPYTIGPLVGASVAVAIAYAIRGRPSEAEEQAAEGEAAR